MSLKIIFGFIILNSSFIIPLSALTLTPPAKITGAVALPGSKSITNRALLVAALAESTSTIRGALKSDDTKYMASALRELGVQIDEPDATTFVVHGRGGHFDEPKQELFLGNAGTAVRFLTAAATLIVGETIITGEERMQNRPIKDLTDALTQLSVKIETNDGCPPVKITSTGKLTGFSVKIRGDISSQYLSALLMVLPYASDKEVKIELTTPLVSKGYVNITTGVMSAFGIMPLSSGERSFVLPKKKYRAADFSVEPDASSATYFWALEKLFGVKIPLANDPKIWTQPDAESRQFMESFPAPLGTIDGSQFPDAVPTLAVLAAFADGVTKFTRLANLRVKECDRLTALATELNKIKPGLAEEGEDFLVVHGDRDLATNGTPTLIATYNDHRIAMAFSLAALKIPGLQIQNPECVKKSFPEYWNVLESLGIGILKI